MFTASGRDGAFEIAPSREAAALQRDDHQLHPDALPTGPKGLARHTAHHLRDRPHPGILAPGPGSVRRGLGLLQHDRAAFYRSGVPPEKLRVLPSFVDTARFTPRGKRSPLPKALKGRFVFLSVFDWQLRKGWDLLLSVYCGKFSPDDGVGLLLKVTTAHGHSAEVVRRQADQVLAPLGQSLQKRPDIVL